MQGPPSPNRRVRLALGVYTLALLGLTVGLWLRQSTRLGDPLIFDRYAGKYLAFVLIFSLAVATHLVLLWGRRATPWFVWPRLLSLAICWLQLNAALTLLHASLPTWWETLAMVTLIAQSLFLPIQVFGLWSHGPGTRAAKTVVGMAAVFGLLFALLVCAELGVRLIHGEDYSFGGLVDNFPYHLNSRGLRGEELPKAKPPGQFRILALGDSVTFGQQVAEDKVFGARLAARLRSDYPDICVINAGIRGTNTVQQAGQLKALMYLKPDLIIQTFVLNDVDETVIQPIFSLHKNPLFGWSLVLRSASMYATQIIVSLGLHPGGGAMPTKGFPAPGWQRARAAMRSIAETAHKHHAKIILGIFPLLTDFQSYPCEEKHRLAAQAAAELGYDGTIDLLPAFRATGVPGRRYRVLPHDGHPSAAAHDVMASAYEKWIRKNMDQMKAKGQGAEDKDQN